MIQSRANHKLDLAQSSEVVSESMSENCSRVRALKPALVTDIVFYELPASACGVKIAWAGNIVT